jgi:hypothetical protein
MHARPPQHKNQARTRQPEAGRRPPLQPAPHERDARVVVRHPARQALARRVGRPRPQLRDAPVQQALVRALQLAAHDDLAADRALQLGQTGAQDGREAAEARELLVEYHLQAVDLGRLGLLLRLPLFLLLLLVRGCCLDTAAAAAVTDQRLVIRIGGLKIRRQRRQNLGRQGAHNLVAAAATAAAAAPATAGQARLDEQHRVQQAAGLLSLEGDIGVGVHPEYIGGLGAGFAYGGGMRLLVAVA